MSNISNDLTKKLQQLKAVPKVFYDKFYALTPKRSGNAKNKTKLSSNIIAADYPYAGPLNKGKSKQAPQGMSKPSLEYTRQIVREFLGK